MVKVLPETQRILDALDRLDAAYPAHDQANKRLPRVCKFQNCKNLPSTRQALYCRKHGRGGGQRRAVRLGKTPRKAKH